MTHQFVMSNLILSKSWGFSHLLCSYRSPSLLLFWQQCKTQNCLLGLIFSIFCTWYPPSDTTIWWSPLSRAASPVRSVIMQLLVIRITLEWCFNAFFFPFFLFLYCSGSLLIEITCHITKVWANLLKRGDGKHLERMQGRNYSCFILIREGYFCDSSFKSHKVIFH